MKNCTSTPFITIEKLNGRKTEKKQQILAFYMRMRKTLFKTLNPDELPKDMADFDHVYGDEGNAAFFAAFDNEGRVIGTIGYLPYDNRFPELNGLYKERKTGELVRCYVDEQNRRQGIGSLLFDAVKDSMKQDGYEIIYLHSHPFLPGGIDFWHKKGFQDVWIEKDPFWNTVHMDRPV